MLASIVTDFVIQGLTTDEPAVLITGAEHRASILRRLSEGDHAPERLRADGRLWLFDATATLSEFMVDGMPVWARFHEAMRCRLRTACGDRGNRRVRVYGDMVDLLWRDGMRTAAIQLEMLWNQLAATEEFSLLCGLSLGSSYKKKLLDGVRAQHTHIVSDDGEARRLN